MLSMSRKDVEADCPEFALIANVTNASKHHTLHRGKPKFRDVSAIDEIVMATEYVGDGAPYTDCFTRVLVELADGSKADLDVAITEVLNYWSNLLSVAGYFKYSARTLPPSITRKRVRRQEARQINFELVRSIDFEAKMVFTRYDLEKDAYVGCDLTDAEMSMEIRKPQIYVLDVIINHPAQEICISLEMTEQESLNFRQAQTEEARREFLAAFQLSRGMEFVAKANSALAPFGASLQIGGETEDGSSPNTFTWPLKETVKLKA